MGDGRWTVVYAYVRSLCLVTGNYVSSASAQPFSDCLRDSKVDISLRSVASRLQYVCYQGYLLDSKQEMCTE